MAYDAFEDDNNPYAAPRTSEFNDPSDDRDLRDVKYGSFLGRFAAAFIDGIVTNLLGMALGFVTGIAMVGADVDPSEGGPQALLTIMGILMAWIYSAGLESSSYQATLGKMALGLKVTDLEGRQVSFGKATGRHFGKIISAIILLIGFLMQPFTEKKQALHDIMAGTLVVK
ncbi:RDD family protein [Rubinisphaera sp.]|uniref:RDD family protein n=1 Tax=Rubinisphaera sp. TaxID=2024857 RepID=UPI000C0D1806|nr:RDD family protein [Rubinisphaera sp.]MBV11195.1 hypothetical protein [Rubinisphaera sp.]HCS51009.1 hypothetical protein [Planctomycetaceae bacterium]